MVPTSHEAQKTSATFDKDLQRLAELEEERGRVNDKAALMEQVATLSAVNLTITPLLVESMLGEAAKLKS